LQATTGGHWLLAMAASTAHRVAASSTRVWHTIDAKGQIAGKVAQRVARLLQGKHKPLYIPGADCGDAVVVLNADQVQFSGNKGTDKVYYWHTGYPGGIKRRTVPEMLEKSPTTVLRRAIWGMLPKNRLAKSRMLRRLRLEASPENKWESQCRASASVAPAFVGEFALRADEGDGTEAGGADASDEETPLVRQLFDTSEPGSVDVGEMEAEQLVEPDYRVLEDVFKHMWQKELDFWAARGTTVPEDIYDRHALPFPGEDAPPLSAADAARGVVQQAREYWEKEGRQSQEARMAEVREFVKKDGVEWRGRQR
jgi:large subunit ribosomal protein L13